MGWLTGIVATSGFSETGDSIESLWARISKPGKLAVEVQLLDRYGIPLGTQTIDDIVYLEIDVKPRAKGPVKVVDALDGQPLFVYEKVQLPYRLGRNFKGQTPGPHTITIGVQDSKGRTGRADLPIQVVHADR